MKFAKNSELAFATVFFAILFIAGPWRQFDALALMPGGDVDARLNNYFLENIYQFAIGKSKSLWNLGFFAPFPYVIGFSDNLFGASPIYLAARFVGLQSDTAFQIWYLAGYLTNYVAAYIALRLLGIEPFGATVGAAIFAFAIPVTAHDGHAQLHHRFGIPLSLATFIDFLTKRDPWRLLQAGFWLVWQFYCGVYMGFFALMLLVAVGVTYLAVLLFKTPSEIKSLPTNLVVGWRATGMADRVKLVGAGALLVSAMMLLFYPYLAVSILYGAHRSWDEISLMLPRPQSYFLVDQSLLWATNASIFKALPMRHEHQMFAGVVPWILLLLGLYAGFRNRIGLTLVLMLGALIIPIVATLYVGGLSFWALLYKLPIASAIRAVTRLDQAILFPMAYLGGLGATSLWQGKIWSKVVIGVLLAGMLTEFSLTIVQKSDKQDWRNRLAAAEKMAPSQLPSDAILFFAQNRAGPHSGEVDAMWVALERGVATLNGYSGNTPPGVDLNFGSNCTELAIRLMSYLNFIGRPADAPSYLALRKRVVPIGFSSCEQYADRRPPMLSSVARSYTPEEIQAITMSFTGLDKNGDDWLLRVSLSNASDQPIAAVSTVGTPLRLSWRFATPRQAVRTGWETRINIPFDIPARGKLEVAIPIKVSPDDRQKSLQVSLVQDGVFWAHDIGMQPLVVSVPVVDGSPPKLTSAARSYTAEEVRAISMASGGLDKNGDDWLLKLTLSNASDQLFSARSAVGTPLRLSWRFATPGQAVGPGWETRFDFPADIPARGKLDVVIPIKVSPDDRQKSLQVSLVQDGVFWAHDIGMPPLVVPFSATGP